MATRSREESLGGPSSFKRWAPHLRHRPPVPQFSSVFLLAIQLCRGSITGDVGGIEELVQYSGDVGAFAIDLYDGMAFRR